MFTMRSILVLVFLAAAAGCAGGGGGSADVPPDPNADVPEAALLAARHVAQKLTSDLKDTLGAEMKAGGPAAAVTVCAEVAQEIALEHTSDAVRVRRVSLRTRNPLNRPDEWEQTWLERMETTPGDAEVVEVVSGERGRVLRYMKPIRVGSVCLQCHGAAESIDPGVLATIRSTYPEDRATGYAAGDLRGAVSVTVWLDS